MFKFKFIIRQQKKEIKKKYFERVTNFYLQMLNAKFKYSKALVSLNSVKYKQKKKRRE